MEPKKKSSRVLAANYRKLADWLDSKPEFEPRDEVAELTQFYFSHKEEFLSFVRAVRNGVKRFTEHDVRFTADTPDGMTVWAEVDRNSVCRIVTPAQPAVYDCEPLLSQDEMAEIE
jgi:hypothetical protein